MDDLLCSSASARSTRSSMTLAALWFRRIRQMTRLLCDRPTSHFRDDGSGPQRSAQLATRRDPELREHPVQVGADRAMREEQSPADLPVGQAVGGELGDLELLGSQLVACLRDATTA